MKKFILSVFFLLGFIAMGTSVSAQSSGKVSFGVAPGSQTFKTDATIILEVRELLPQLYNELGNLDTESVAHKQKMTEITLFKTFSGDLQDGKPAATSYQSVLNTFDDAYITSTAFWTERKLSIVQSFNNLVFN